jgi:hypothetical protein
LVTSRNAIVEWYQAGEVRLTDDAEARLDTICRTCHAIVEHIPIDRLDPLLQRAGRPLVNAVDQLHLRVRQTVVESLSAG